MNNRHLYRQAPIRAQFTERELARQAELDRQAMFDNIALAVLGVAVITILFSLYSLTVA